MLFFLDSLQISQESVSLQCVFHSIRFKVNKGWSTAVLLFFALYFSFLAANQGQKCKNLSIFFPYRYTI
jgi:hypothetical protein